MKRNKPKFYRQTWHKVIRIGKTVKKKRKWRASKGRDSKIRLKMASHASRPTIGWGADKSIKGKVNGLYVTRVENVNDLAKVPKGNGIIIGRIGKRKLTEVLKKAGEMKLIVLNRYRNKNATI